MGLPIGTKLGPYQIVSFIGAGGMGEVYRAKDTRLDRTVAIKILKADQIRDASAKERFDREARTISSLNHPNICQLYDVGEQDGLQYLVMEYLDGQTLAERLLSGPMRLDQVLKSGIEICKGLERAHRLGIIHRDLKPGNIIMTTTGLKLMDFGLAKPIASPDSRLTMTISTPQHPLTTEGRIVGTVHYMAPEQAQGAEVDHQSDIFSVGAILYEMSTGKKAFPGQSPLSVISAVLEKSPAPISALKPGTPAALEHAVSRCLAKDREGRWLSAHDLGLELQWIGETPLVSEAQSEVTRRARFREWAGWVVAVFAIVSLVVMMFGVLHHKQEEGHQIRSSILPPSGSSFLPYNFAIAPNGSRLAFVALGSDGKTTLWVRSFSSASAQQLTGTDGAIYPFWSPDSLHIGFFAEGRLKTVDLVNSAVQSICEAGTSFGGSWNRNGDIVFAPLISGPIYRVSSGGGTPEAVTKIEPNSGEANHWPYFMPDGKHFLYLVSWSAAPNQKQNGLYVGSLDKQAPVLISTEIQGNVLFAASHLLYVRDRAIVAQPFDADHLITTGPGIPVTQPEVEKFFDFWQSGFSVSQEGKLVFQSAADSPSRLVWYDPAGKELTQFGETGYEGPQFSPDGQWLAVYADDEHNGKHFIRLYDLRRGLSSRLTDGGNESNPVWSRDAKAIAFRDASMNIEMVSTDGSSAARKLVNGANVIPCDWSAHGDLLYMSIEGGTFPALRLYSTLDQKSVQLAKAGAEPQFSPDGRWVAYIELPTRQIVVERFPGPGGRVQISNVKGSAQPRWSHDGRKIFYIQPDRKLMVATFDPAQDSAGAPQLFAQTRIVVTTFGWFQYAVAPDGRVLVNSLPANNSAPLTLVSGWETAFDRH